MHQISPSETKTCIKCETAKPLTEFPPRKSSPDGRRSECRACTRTAHQQWRNDNHDELRQKQQRYYEANRERINAYYREWKRERGGHKPRATLGMDVAERLAYHAEPGRHGCLLWTGSKAGSLSHGQIVVEGHKRYAHRVAWELINGPVPEGKHLHHLCRNPACINPDHLTPLTPAEHIAVHRAEKGLSPQ